MTQTNRAVAAPSGRRTRLNKVPEVIIWFWVIKVLCTTIGESFADWINTSLGFGLEVTSLLFTVVLVGVLAVQLRLHRYVPFVYWLVVVVLSVTGTLYTDILTDDLNVPLGVATAVFSAVLAVVFGIWYAREGTLSIHSIVTLPREAFYWLAVLVTFALGTAAGDWTLQLTGWGPGTAVLLPTALIAAVVVGWRSGANAVLSFWLAYILTRPLGANLGDWLASPAADGGLGLGTGVTSVIFLLAILATVTYLTITRKDVVENYQQAESTVERRAGRERVLLGYFGAVAVATGVVLAAAYAQPHAEASTDEAAAPNGANSPSQALTPAQETQNFDPAEVGKLRVIVQDTQTRLEAGDQAAATTRIKDLETTWDADQSSFQGGDQTAWQFLDGQIDVVLTSLRANPPDKSTELNELGQLLQSLG